MLLQTTTALAIILILGIACLQTGVQVAILIQHYTAVIENIVPVQI